MDIKFESGIPIPDRRDKSKYECLDNMKVGESFALPYSASVQQSLRQAFSIRQMKCAFRKQDNNTMRVWRTE
tara:strand:- start:191 stop:406 length:216 start_codon:yes stop_codon:yes gene_type:complete